MNQETTETQTQLFGEAHPWITLKPETEEEDPLGEVLRYTLDELRLA